MTQALYVAGGVAAFDTIGADGLPVTATPVPSIGERAFAAAALAANVRLINDAGDTVIAAATITVGAGSRVLAELTLYFASDPGSPGAVSWTSDVSGQVYSDGISPQVGYTRTVAWLSAALAGGPHTFTAYGRAFASTNGTVNPALWTLTEVPA